MNDLKAEINVKIVKSHTRDGKTLKNRNRLVKRYEKSNPRQWFCPEFSQVSATLKIWIKI